MVRVIKAFRESNNSSDRFCILDSVPVVYIPFHNWTSLLNVLDATFGICLVVDMVVRVVLSRWIGGT